MMTPYRMRPTRAGSALRVAEPISALTAVLLCALVVASVGGALLEHDGQLLRDASLWWQSPAALVLFSMGCAIAAVASRRETWISLEPTLDRVRIVRRHGLSVATSILRLRSGLSAEYASFGRSTWLVLGRDEEVALILPATASLAGAQERIAAAIEDALTVRA